jgi:hypothetical protein
MAIGKAMAHFGKPPSAQFLLRMRGPESFLPESAGISCAMFIRDQNPLYSLDLNSIEMAIAKRMYISEEPTSAQFLLRMRGAKPLFPESARNFLRHVHT